jgi:hypothetical protein
VVFGEIRKCGSAAASNAFAWRCVHTALNAAKVGEPVDPQSGLEMVDREVRRYNPLSWPVVTAGIVSFAVVALAVAAAVGWLG